MIDSRAALPGFGGCRRRIRGYGALLALLVAAVCTLPAPSAADAQERPTVVIAFHPGGGVPGPGRTTVETVFERLAARPALSLGFVGATQGAYTARQAVLDMSAGNRVSRSGYADRAVPFYVPRRTDDGWRIARWAEVVRRARTAPTEIVPGLLAGSIEGGAAHVAPDRRPAFEAALAANRQGHIAGVSTGSPATVAARTRRALAAHDLAVVTLPRGEAGDRTLDELLAQRPPEQLLLVIRRPPRSSFPQMLPFGAAGLPGGGLLVSGTTRRPGLVAATDVAPTVLRWLGHPMPTPVVGREITAEGERDVTALRSLERRLRAVYPRRFPALFAVFTGLAATALALSLAGGRAGRRQALRVCALAVLWIPFVSLVGAALEPTRAGELALMGAGTVALALLTDRLLPWPRGPLLPALLAVPAYVADLAMGSDLIVRSLLGPNPRFGSRFWGIGNELEATLPLLLLVGLAALVGRAPRTRLLAAGFAAAMLLLAVAVSAGRLGADVGGVITVGVAGAVATVVLLPGGLTRRRVLLTLAVPVVGLLALAAIDTVTGGDAHFTTTVLGAEDADALARTVARRYELAWQTLTRGAMPVLTVVAVAMAVAAFRWRHRLYAPVAARPAWVAALAGGLAGSAAGALTNDSGPVLLVIGVFILAWATAYIQGDPRLAAGSREPMPSARGMANAPDPGNVRVPAGDPAGASAGAGGSRTRLRRLE